MRLEAIPWAAVAVFWAAFATSTDALRLQQGHVCKLVTFVPFTDLRPGMPPGMGNDEDNDDDENDDVDVVDNEIYGFGAWPNPETLAKASFSLVAAAELARKEFNARSSAIVPSLAKTLMGCPIRLETENSPGQQSWYLDSAHDRTTTVESFMDLHRLGIQQSGETDPLGNVCAVIAPQDPRPNEGLAVLTEHRRIPQVAYATIDESLSQSDLFPTFARVIPSAKDFAATIAKYLQRDIWQRDHLAILSEESEYGEPFELSLEHLEHELGYETMTEHIIAGNEESVADALGKVKERGFHTIILITNRPTFIDTVASVADEVGVLGEDYFWTITGAALPPVILSTLQHPVDSPTDRMLRGAALFTNYDPFVYNGESDAFLEVWRRQDSALVNRVNNLQPRNPEDNSTYFIGGASYFQDETPTEYASFMYDAVMATGISACKAFSSGERQPGGHSESLQLSSFRGASGFVQFAFNEQADALENGRDPSGVPFGVYNIRPREADVNGMRGYETVLTSIYSHENEFVNELGQVERGAWANVDDAPFVFYDQTENEPMPLRTVADPNYLSDSAQVAGFVLMSVALAIAVFSAIWVLACRKTEDVKASQPEFLYLLCFGASLVAASLVWVSFDEGQGWSTSQLDFGCSAFPWFFVIGYLVMYCALFCKLWRLSKVLSMRRQKVDFKSVMKPFVIIIVISIGVLIFWQVSDPMQWEREVVNEDPLETYGECTNENGFLLFVILLGVLCAIIMAMTAYMAWRLKNVQEELSESKWIFFGILTHIQTWAIGVPILVITDDVSKDANYVMMACLSFIFSTSLVTFVIWPKLYTWAFVKEPEKQMHFGLSGQSSTRITGLESSGSSSGSSKGYPSFQVRVEQRKVAQLEKEVAELREQLLNRDKEDDENAWNNQPQESAPLTGVAMASTFSLMEGIPEVSEHSHSEISMSPVRTVPKPSIVGTMPVMEESLEIESSDPSINVLESSDKSFDLLNPTDAEMGSKESSSSIDFGAPDGMQNELNNARKRPPTPVKGGKEDSSSSIDFNVPETEAGPKNQYRKRPSTPPMKGLLKNPIHLEDSEESLDFGSPGEQPSALLKAELESSDQSIDLFL